MPVKYWEFHKKYTELTVSGISDLLEKNDHQIDHQVDKNGFIGEIRAPQVAGWVYRGKIFRPYGSPSGTAYQPEVAVGWDFLGIPNPGILRFLSQKIPKSVNPGIPGFSGIGIDFFSENLELFGIPGNPGIFSRIPVWGSREFEFKIPGIGIFSWDGISGIIFQQSATSA